MSRERSPGQEVPLGRQLWTPYQYGEFVKPEYFDLPIAEHKQQITDAIRENQVVIVVGETGQRQKYAATKDWPRDGTCY